MGLSDGLLAHSAQPAKLCHSTQQWGATELASEREAIRDHLMPETHGLGRVPGTKVALITNIRITRLSHEAEGNIIHWKRSLELIQWTVMLERSFDYLCLVISSSLYSPRALNPNTRCSHNFLFWHSCPNLSGSCLVTYIPIFLSVSPWTHSFQNDLPNFGVRKLLDQVGFLFSVFSYTLIISLC